MLKNTFRPSSTNDQDLIKGKFDPQNFRSPNFTQPIQQMYSKNIERSSFASSFTGNTNTLIMRETFSSEQKKKSSFKNSSSSLNGGKRLEMLKTFNNPMSNDHRGFNSNSTPPSNDKIKINSSSFKHNLMVIESLANDEETVEGSHSGQDSNSSNMSENITHKINNFKYFESIEREKLSIAPGKRIQERKRMLKEV
jgi:hypothetical protein